MLDLRHTAHPRNGALPENDGSLDSVSLFQSDALARWLQGTHSGPSVEWRTVSSITAAGPNDLAFYLGTTEVGNAGVILCSTPVPDRCCIVVEDPKLSFILVIKELFHVEQFPKSTVHPTAVIHSGAVIMDGVTVGPRTTVFPNAVLYPRTTVGSDCVIQAGTIIGASGFGVHPTPNGPVSIPHIGGVTIRDGVELGANTTIDRGFLEDTHIGADCRIDNQVHIGHNCRIGRGVIIAAQTGVSGSVVIEDGVMIGGQAGIVEHTIIGKGARIGAQSGVLKNVPPGESVLGTPAHQSMKMKRLYATLLQDAHKPTS